MGFVGRVAYTAGPWPTSVPSRQLLCSLGINETALRPTEASVFNDFSRMEKCTRRPSQAGSRALRPEKSQDNGEATSQSPARRPQQSQQETTRRQPLPRRQTVGPTGDGSIDERGIRASSIAPRTWAGSTTAPSAPKYIEYASSSFRRSRRRWRSVTGATTSPPINIDLTAVVELGPSATQIACRATRELGRHPSKCTQDRHREAGG